MDFFERFIPISKVLSLSPSIEIEKDKIEEVPAEIVEVKEKSAEEKFDEIFGVFRLKDKITVYSLEQNFSFLSIRDYVELMLIINHHTILLPEEEIKKVEDKVGNMFIFEEQYKRLSKKMKSYYKPIEIVLR